MAIEVVMPRQGNTVESCLIAEWRVAVGDTVDKGQVLCEIETDKSSIEIEAEQEGTVLALLHQAGDEVPVLKPILVLGTPGEDISGFLADALGDSPDDHAAAPATEDSKATRAPTPQDQPAPPRAAISPRARMAAAQRGVDYQNLQGSGPAGRILERDILSFADAHPSLSPAARAEGATAGARGSGIGGRPRPGDAARVPASGAVATTDAGATHGAPELGTAAATALGRVAGEGAQGRITQIPQTGIRRIIAARMTESLRSTAQFTLNASADARSLLAWREKFKASREDLGLRGITLGDMVVFAASRILPRYPALNAELREGVLHQFDDVHLSLAVDTPRGLMVPVLRSAQTKSLKQISDETKALAAECQAGSIAPTKLAGGSFTLSNLGSFGIESFTPVLNAPQVAILGVCAIGLKPVETTAGVEFLPHMGFSLTIDHQAVDGAPAARFLKDLCAFLGDFELVSAL